MLCSSLAYSQGEFVCKIACLSNSPVPVSSTPVLAWGDSCCCWWLSICSALPVYGREAEREHRPHLLHWYLLSLHICGGWGGGGKGPIPSWCFSALADTHMCTRTLKGSESDREREREREIRGKWTEREKCCSYEPEFNSDLTWCGLDTKQAV